VSRGGNGGRIVHHLAQREIDAFRVSHREAGGL
jgi:hypothetical protein